MTGLAGSGRFVSLRSLNDRAVSVAGNAGFGCRAVSVAGNAGHRAVSVVERGSEATETKRAEPAGSAGHWAGASA